MAAFAPPIAYPSCLPEFTVSGTKANPTLSKARDITFSEAQPVLQTFSDDLPSDLRGLTLSQIRSQWTDYVCRHDADTRERLLQGDEDSLVNLLLYGTSFTDEPRVTREFLAQAETQIADAKGSGENSVTMVLQRRIAALVNALSTPGSNDRLRYLRQLLEGKGIRFNSAADRQKAEHYLLGLLEHVRVEFSEYHKAIEAARATGDPTQEFAVRSTLFKDRGISLDTSIMPDYALQEALKDLLNRGTFTKGSIRRVAIIGPGLDFSNKSEGYDFYPPQITQPFLLMDSLLRLGLAKKDDLKIIALDISPRVNQQLRTMRQGATQGKSYVLQFPLPADRKWEPGARQFWQTAGEFVGTQTKPIPPPQSTGKLETRAVRIPPSTVLRVVPEDLNIVWQRTDLPAAQQYDLVVATNVLVYYDEFHQALALDNIQSMLRENGILLTNNGLPAVPSLAMNDLGHTAVAYSDQSSDGDYIVWFQHVPQGQGSAVAEPR